MASIVKRNNRYCVVYTYKHTNGTLKQKWETFTDLLNPGSVSIPKENSAHGYMIYDQEFIWKDLDGNVIDMM